MLIGIAALCQLLFSSVYWWILFSRAGYESIPYVLAGSGLILVVRLVQNVKKRASFHWDRPTTWCLTGALVGNALLLVFADPWLLAAALVCFFLAIENGIRGDDGRRLYGGVVLPFFALLLPLFSIDMAINDRLGQWGFYCGEQILRVPGILVVDEEIPFRINDDLRIMPLDFSIGSMLGVPFLLAIGLTLIGLYARRLFHAFLLCIAVGFWSVFGQTLFLVTLGVCFQLLLVDVTAESASLIEVLIVLVTGLLIISTDQFLAFWLGPVTKESLDSSSDLVARSGRFWNRCLASRLLQEPNRRRPDSRGEPGKWWITCTLLSILLGGIGFARFLVVEKPAFAQLPLEIEKEDFRVEPATDLIRHETKRRNRTSSTGALEHRWYYYYDGLQCLVSASELDGRWADPAAEQKRRDWNVEEVAFDNGMERIRLSKESGEQGLLFIKELASVDRLSSDPLGHFPTWGSPVLSDMFLSKRVYMKVFIQFFEEPDAHMVDQLKNNLHRLESTLDP